jgi:hypothetical protein
MWFYLYLISTAYHFQKGWSLVGLTSNVQSEYTHLCKKVEFPDPWKIVTVYQFPKEMIRYPILTLVTQYQPNYIENSTSLHWYGLNLDRVEFTFELMNITYYEVNLNAKKVHDEL